MSDTTPNMTVRFTSVDEEGRGMAVSMSADLLLKTAAFDATSFQEVGKIAFQQMAVERTAKELDAHRPASL